MQLHLERGGGGPARGSIDGSIVHRSEAINDDWNLSSTMYSQKRVSEARSKCVVGSDVVAQE